MIYAARYFLVPILFFAVIFLTNNDAHAQGWQWARGNTGGSMNVCAAATDDLGNIFISGFTIGSAAVTLGGITVPNTTGSQQCIVAKFDSNGNVIWAKGIQKADSHPISITTDPEGNLILLGIGTGDTQIDTFNLHTSSFSFGAPSYYFLARFDPLGNVIWAKKTGFASVNTTPLISVDSWDAGGVATDADGNILITGNYDSPFSIFDFDTVFNCGPSPYTSDAFIAKYNSSGNLVWVTNLGGDSTDATCGIAVSSGSNIYVTGAFKSHVINTGKYMLSNPHPGIPSAFIAELDKNGSFQWAESGGGDRGAVGVGIASDKGGNVFLTGAFSDSSISFGGTNIFTQYPIATSSYFHTSALFMLQLNSVNDIAWSKAISSPASGVGGYSVAYTQCGEVWVAGYCYRPGKDSLNIDGNILCTPDSGANASFFVGYNLLGEVIGYVALPFSGYKNNIAVDNIGNLYTSGTYNNSFLSNFIVGSDTLANVYDRDFMFLAKYQNKIPNSEIYYLNSDTIFCSESSISLQSPDGYAQYLWNTGVSASSLQVSSAGVYWVNCRKDCASPVLIDTITVREKSCDCWSTIPNAFTPNNDGKNDGFKAVIQPGCQISNYSLSIFDRWGELLFNTHDPDARWNGEYGGIDMEIGTYMYYVSYTNDRNKKKVFYKGDVVLIR